MSAHAALASLRRILIRILYPKPKVVHNSAQLHILLEETCLLLNFLGDSRGYKASETVAALEAKMRGAAQKAEDFIECGDNRKYSTQEYFRRVGSCALLYALVVALLIDVIHATYSIAILGWILYVLAEVLLCVTHAVLMYAYVRAAYVLPALNDAQELRRVLYDFNIMAKDVIQIKKARGDPEMSPQEAVISLLRILDSVLDSGGRRLSSCNRVHLECLREKVSFLVDFISSSTYYSNLSIQNLDETIRNAVYKAKRALIEFHSPGKCSLHVDWKCTLTVTDIHVLVIVLMSLYFRLVNYMQSSPREIILSCLVILGHLCMGVVSFIGSAVIVFLVLKAQYTSEASENQELPHVVYDFSTIVIKIKDGYANSIDSPPVTAAATSSSREEQIDTSKDDVVVGLDSYLITLVDCLVQDSSERQLVSIVGMGGIGKTTLAKEVYKDQNIINHFDVRAWVTVSQEYSLRHVLLCLLDSAQCLTEEKRQDSDDVLALYIHKHLFSRRYLIVMDDVWDAEIWNFLSRYFPDNGNGSRVLLTSRLMDVAALLDSSSCLYQMQCLNDNDCWDLLCRKVFGEEGCPLGLESIGREIATSCRGVPLATVVLGGLLYKDIRIEVWRDVARKLKMSELQDIKEHCLEILGLSYTNLPHHLRTCFLYMGVFPADCQIPVSRIINLWIAEGFIEPHYQSQNLEEVAAGYLHYLIARNLVLVCKRSCNGMIRTCSIHDLLRDVCVHNARKENFLHFVDSGEYGTRERSNESPRRLSIHRDALQGNTTHELMSSYDYVRSFVCIDSKPVGTPSVFYLGYLYLRVLDVLEVHFGKFPRQITKLLFLRYLAFHYDGSLPRSILNLWDLETIVHHSSFRKYSLLPSVIWDMPRLRHLYVKPGCYILNPLGYQFSSSSFLSDLQTLVGVRNFKWTKRITEILPNMMKLGISYDVSSSIDWSMYQLENLVYLGRLENLKIIVKYNDPGSIIYHDHPKLAFPQKLRKLSLSGCRIPWESMIAIGAFPNLEALKLRQEACYGPSWETVEEQFPQLVFLLLEEMSFTRWETDAAHFPRLKSLVIRSCGMLEEIPSAIGDIPTLVMVQLVDCNASAVASANEIQEEQESMGNEDLKFHIGRRRDVDGMNMANLETREVFPGHIEVLIDAVQSAQTEILLVLSTLVIVLYFSLTPYEEYPPFLYYHN